MGVFDVPAGRLIGALAADLELKHKLEKPAFTDFVKTGAQAERAPQQANWWYLRMGSLLYRLYKEGATGVGSFRSYYGGRKSRGVKPHRHMKAGGKVIRLALQELEKAGLVKKSKKGRIVSAKGESLLLQKSKEISGVWLNEEIGRAQKKRAERLEKAKLTAKEAPKESPKKKKGKKEEGTGEEGAEAAPKKGPKKK